MNVNKTLVILWLSASKCLAEIIKDESSKTDKIGTLTDATVEILSRCCRNQVSTVGFAGIPDNFLLETLYSHGVPVVLIGNDTDDGPFNRGSRHKLQLFVVTASSSNQLNKTLGQIKSSLWWNHMATYLIINSQSTKTKHGCSNAFEFLWKSWQMNLLKATYLCLHHTKGTLIYSYNPYTSKVPKPWHLNDTYKGNNNHPWTMFLRDYYNDEEVCENLEFDKTNDLAGYEIFLTVKELRPSLIIDSNKTGIDCMTGHSGNLARSIFHALNATARLKIHDPNLSPGFLDTKGNDIAMETVNGISDVHLVPRLHMSVKDFTVSYAFYQTGFNIVTQFSGDQSQLQKLLTVLDKSSRIGLCLVILTIVIFLKFFRQQSLGTAILNTLRIVVNSSLTKVPNNQGSRIYLACVFILVVTIVGIYQGMLSSLLTKSKPLPNVETLQDLVDRNYMIHIHKSYAHFLPDKILKNRLIPHEDLDCTRYVIVDPLAGCVGPQLLVFNTVTKHKLHISRELFFKSNLVYVIRKDWPLEQRFNKVLAALTEAYITQYEFEKKMLATLEIGKFNKNLEKNRKFKMMILSELIFAFAILGIGLACATVCFIVEIAVSPTPCSRNENMGNGFRY